LKKDKCDRIRSFFPGTYKKGKTPQGTTKALCAGFYEDEDKRNASVHSSKNNDSKAIWNNNGENMD
jgi:hypothetical protein